jgi:AcrR family transcriptional regulator
VRAGTIYNRFGGREGLLDAVVADVAAGWLRAVCDQSLAFGAELIRDAQSCGTLRPGFSAGDLARIFAVNAYLVRDRPAGDDGWRRTLQFTLDGLRAQPDSTSE